MGRIRNVKFATRFHPPRMKLEDKVETRTERFYKKFGYDWLKVFYPRLYTGEKEQCKYSEICRAYNPKRNICSSYDGDKSKCVEPNYIEVV